MIDAGCDIAWSTAWRPALRAWGPPSWRNFNHLFGVCAARVFPAWYGRGLNYWLPLVPRRRVSRADAANGRVTGRRPDRNLVVGASGIPMPDRQCMVGQAPVEQYQRYY